MEMGAALVRLYCAAAHHRRSARDKQDSDYKKVGVGWGLQCQEAARNAP